MTFPKLSSLIVILSFFLGNCAESFAAISEYRGGSNYAFYALDGCKRDGSIVIRSYNQQKNIINRQLAGMYTNGQRRLRLPIFFRDGNTTSGLLDSSGGDLHPQDKANLAAFLAAVKQTGFEQVEIGFFPIGESSPATWKEWKEDTYQENWHLIQNLRPIFAASGLPYLIDLDNEATPASNQKILLQYTQHLWTDYTRAFGKQDTIGFSIIPNPQQDRFAQTAQIYGTNPPDALDLHFYENSYENIINAHNRLSLLGYGNIPWIIGEAYYNDAQEADEIAKAISQTHQKLLFITEWPLTREKTCHDVDVAPPTEFNQYAKHGF